MVGTNATLPARRTRRNARSSATIERATWMLRPMRSSTSLRVLGRRGN
jgi:hypothetical protein